MKGKTLEIIADVDAGDADAPGPRVFRSEGRAVELRYNMWRGSLVLDRFRSGNTDFRDAFANDGGSAHGGEARWRFPTDWPLASIWQNEG